MAVSLTSKFLHIKSHSSEKLITLIGVDQEDIKVFVFEL